MVERHSLIAYSEYVGEDFEADMKVLEADPVSLDWWSHTDPCQTPVADAPSDTLWFEGALVSGLTMEADWAGWTVNDLERAVVVALDCFGAERLMFGSDWPLVEVCGGYGAWLNAAHRLTSGLGAGEQNAIFSGTARSAYRIGTAIHA